MYIYHNSHDEFYRSPFGAVRTNAAVRLRLFTSEEKADKVWVRLWIEDCEKLTEMSGIAAENGVLFEAEIRMPEKPCLVWYYFVIEKDGRRLYFSNREDRLGGEGILTDYPTDISYQITVYSEDFETPEWFRNSVMYQIFPDRFYRCGEISEIPKKRPEYTIHEDWYEPLTNSRHPYEDGPACNDFYGGSLKGITAKLGYLKELGISVIYLNPIFEAYSNHRYDTGDYSKIDPILGSEEDFRELCEKCREIGMRVILDGVFSHTGSDSIYFNKYKSYGADAGAYQSADSPYREWYQWKNDAPFYESWWGCSNLPNINETNPTYVDYILTGRDAIIKKWLRLGASGWRLDVADELPDEFIKTLRTSVKSENPDAVIIGEVWEDASNKVSYSMRREYLFGHELDSVMNYPFKDAIIAFSLGHISAEILNRRIMSICENYPKEALYAAMNLLGTHDTMRIKTVMSGTDGFESLSFEEKGNFRLSPMDETKANKRLRLAVFLQMTFIGVPSVYYGDEIGMQGLSDPFNRMPYTWRCIDPEMLSFYKKMIAFRNSEACLRTGGFEALFADGGVYVYKRFISGGRDVFGKKAQDSFIICAVNHGGEDQTVKVKLANCGCRKLNGLFSGCEIPTDGGSICITVKAESAEAYVQPVTFAEKC